MRKFSVSILVLVGLLGGVALNSFTPAARATGMRLAQPVGGSVITGSTSVLTPLVDAPSSGPLALGTTNATEIDANAALVIAANKNVSCASGTTAVDFSTGSGTFKTTTGTNTLSGTTSIAANKNLSCASGTTAVDFSSGSGLFKTTTGAATIGPGAVGISGLATFSAGILASGSTANDFSGSSGTFLTPTGAVTIGPGAITVSGSVAASGSNNIDLSAGTGQFKTPTGAATIGGGNNAVTVSTGTATFNIASTAATARAGMRNANTRNIIRAGSVAVPDCTGSTLTLSVTQFLDAGVATCATAQTINFPTWQGASGIVQGLPGTPAVGDFVEFLVVASAANALTVGAGTGGTLGGSATVPANTDKLYRCRITAITGNSETATCY